MTSLRTATARLFERLRPEEAEGIEADLVVAPTTVAEAAQILGHAADAGIRVEVRGGGTHLGLGPPLSADMVLLTTRLDAIVDFQPEDLTIVVEAGVRLVDLHEVLVAQGKTAVLPEQAGLATIGGVVAAGVSGYRRLRYGPTRDRVLQVTLATGYGQVATAGGRVVKNSTGYDLPRVVTGSLGSLGVIGSVCLKLWPQPRHTATLAVGDAAAAFIAAYRPLAVVETEAGSWVFLGGTDEEIEAEAQILASTATSGLHWPDALAEPVRFSLRVPAREVAAGVDRVRELGGARYRAQHGVGVIDVGVESVADEDLVELRDWAEAATGSLVLIAGPVDLYARFDPWGTPPGSIDIQRRLKAAFDPAGILNVGKLPGGL